MSQINLQSRSPSNGMGANASSSHDSPLFPISDEELLLQEAFASSLLLTSITKSENGGSSRSCSETFCVICTDTKSPAEMFTSGLCSHSFCSDCISKHIAAKLEDSMAVKCPEPKCAAALEPEMCGSLVPKEVFERWGDALFQATILKMKRLYCPFEECSAVREVECPNCRRIFCAQCKVGWHAEMECGEFQKLQKLGRRDRDDAMTTMLADRKKWKRCPNCNIYVEKIEGCLHITCRCGSQFCYSCGSKWGGSHACPPSAYERSVYVYDYDEC